MELSEVERMKKAPTASTPRIQPLVVALKSHPPVIALSYNEWNDGEKKLRSRYMPLRGFTKSSDVRRSAFTLRHRHSKFLEDVPAVLIEKGMRIIQEIQKGIPVGKLSPKLCQAVPFQRIKLTGFVCNVMYYIAISNIA